MGSVPLVRILVTNHHLVVRSGSELATLEVTRRLLSEGHEVAVFTPFAGRLAEEVQAAEGITVLGISDRRRLRKFAPDVIHVHHWPTVVALESLGVVAPWVIGFHGKLPLECPPTLIQEAEIPWWGMCEGTMIRVQRDESWAKCPQGLVRNWFDDTSFERPEVPDNRGLASVVIVSNHFPSAVMEALHALGERMGFAVTHVGRPDNVRIVDARLLLGYDCVVTTGRTAVLAMALGLPCLVLDHFGADGWITPETVSASASRNYSGLAFGLDPSPAALEGWLSERPSVGQLEQVQDWVYQEATLTQAMERLVGLYGQGVAVPPSHAFGSWTPVVAAYLKRMSAAGVPY